MENNFTNQNYDFCAYDEKLRRTMAPGLYNIQTPSNDCNSCYQDIPADPNIRYQKYGNSKCPQGNAIDDESELKGINYKNSKCNDKFYLPGSYTTNSSCNVKGVLNARDCGFQPQESTRLSNPVCNLHGTGINRWNWLCFEPQEHAIQEFSREGTDVKTLFKDNHKPCLDNIIDQNQFMPFEKNNSFDPSYKVPTDNNLNTLSNRYPYGFNSGPAASKCIK
jgi:hypothetical protein